MTIVLKSSKDATAPTQGKHSVEMEMGTPQHQVVVSHHRI
jgi:hypothetical protein